jgi:hypothetical protein
MLGIVGKNATGGQMSNRPNIAPAAYQVPGYGQ